MRIALDAMGGDYAPKNIIEGAVLALKEYSYVEKLYLVGDAEVRCLLYAGHATEAR